MAVQGKAGLRSEVVRLIGITENELSQWSVARDDMPFPDFSDGMTNDKAWQAGISEGVEKGRLSALKEILEKLSD